MTKTFTNPFTADGAAKPQVGVTREKVAYATELIQETMNGNRAAKGVLEEAMVSTDAIFNVAHIAQVQLIQDFPKTEDADWSSIATARTVPDFRPATLYSLRPDWSAGGTLGSGEPTWVAPKVPEAANYPYAYLTEEVDQAAGGIVKRGFKTGFTFEAFINDSIGFLQALPTSMLDIAVDTDKWEVFSALISGVGATQQLDGGSIPYGEDVATVAPNAPISRNALIRAMIELGEREINGRKVIVSGGYTLVIPAGQKLWVDYILNNIEGPTGYEDGSFTFTINGYNPLAGIEVIESEFVTGTAWYLIPKANSARRPVLELLRLVGHENPEVRVQGNTGTYVGGGAVNPFEGSFDNDTADFRLRMFSKGQLWTPDLVVWSNGTGS